MDQGGGVTFAELEQELRAGGYTLSVRFVETHYVVRIMLGDKAVGASASDSLESAIHLAFQSVGK